MDKKPKIKPVDSNKSKGKTYRVLMAQYKSAMENGYYGEAELITYAYIEDRLKAFLYYSDALNSRNATSINENMVDIMGSQKSINNISDKIEVIRSAFKACNQAKNDNLYAQHLKTVYRVSIDIREMKSKLKELEKWCDYRNEIVHAIFNTDLDALHSIYKEHVEKGFSLGRYFDHQVALLANA